MKTKGDVMKTLATIFSIALAAFLSAPAVQADTVTTTTTTTIRTDAPIYAGPVENVTVLEPLTLEDFQTFGTKPPAAFEEYQEYKRDLDDRGPDAVPILYKMRVERTLTAADFQGPGVSPELAQARYEDYLRSKPVHYQGREGRYVFVYHLPV
jgi:hypothetical protein